MRIILVTSTLTYTPDNYENILEDVLRDSKENVVGVVLVSINPFGILRKLPLLYCVGCERMVKTLIKNLGRDFQNKKAKLISKHNIPLIVTNNINSLGMITWIKERSPDLIINMRTRCFYSKGILDMPTMGCVNIHHGLLPKQRGLFCDLHALGNGRETGFTIHRMTDEIDGGEVFFKKDGKFNLDYMQYLSEISADERGAVVDFINEVHKTEKLPKGEPNICDQPVKTTTPNLKTIRVYQKKGLIL